MKSPLEYDHDQIEVCGLPEFPFGIFHKVSDIITGGILAVNWIYPLLHIKKIAQTIPISYSLQGAVNWSGKKYLIFLVPLGATVTYLHYLYQMLHPDRALFPIRAPENVNPGKIATLAKTLTKIVSFYTQLFLLATSALLVKGPGLDKEIRAKWIKRGILANIILTVLTYGGIRYLLNHKFKSHPPTQKKNSE